MATDFFDGEWQPCVISSTSEGHRVVLGEAPPSTPRADFILSVPFTDWHVHTALAPTAELMGTVIRRVLDLGANPNLIADQAKTSHRPQILYAGAFLTARGGYPSDRVWAPEGSVIEIETEHDAVSAAQKMKELGAAFVKVAQNSSAGPVFHEKQFRAIVRAAETVGLHVIAHAEGVEQAKNARLWGAKVLAHTPFSEVLSDAEIVAQARDVIWVTTLDIHGWGAKNKNYEIAVTNLARFTRANGRVLYGTDMGNGPTINDLNQREIAAMREAGCDDDKILAALVGAFIGSSSKPEELVAVASASDKLDFSKTRLLTNSTIEGEMYE